MAKLGVVQCGGSKIWKKNPEMEEVPSKDAYISPYFRYNRAYAERFTDDWVILSAKYGFLNPDEMISDYNVTFKKKSTDPISNDELREQVKRQNLEKYDEIVVLGGSEYYLAVKEAFRGTKCRISSPHEGLSIGRRMSAIKKELGV